MLNFTTNKSFTLKPHVAHQTERQMETAKTKMWKKNPCKHTIRLVVTFQHPADSVFSTWFAFLLRCINVWTLNGRKFRNMLSIVEVAMQLFDDSCGPTMLVFLFFLFPYFFQTHLRPIGIIAAFWYCLKITKQYKYSNLAERLYNVQYTDSQWCNARIRRIGHTYWLIFPHLSAHKRSRACTHTHTQFT